MLQHTGEQLIASGSAIFINSPTLELVLIACIMDANSAIASPLAAAAPDGIMAAESHSPSASKW